MAEGKVNSNQIAKASKWSVLSEIMAKIAAPIVNMVLARLLVPEEFGVIASITIITSFADLFTDAGFQRYLIQHEFENDEELEKCTNVSFWSNFTLSVIIFLIILIFNRQLAVLVGCSTANVGIIIAALAVICTSFSSTVVARYRRSLNFKPLFYSRLISSFIPLVVTVPLAAILRSYWAMIIGTLAQKLFISVFLTIRSEWKPRKFYSFEILRKMVPFSVWNLLESLAIWFAGQANVFIVANTLNSYYLGLYKTGMSTVNSYMAVITASITPVVFSALSRYQNDDKNYRNTFLKFQKVISLLVLPMGAGLLIYRRFAVTVLLGSKWMEVSDFLGLWAFMSSLTITYGNMASEVYRSKGKPNVSFVLQMIYMVVYIPAIIIGARSGFQTLCLISCTVRIIPIIMDLLCLNLMFHITIKEVLYNTLPSIASTIIMLFLAIALRIVNDSPVWVIFSIMCCIVTYFGVSMAFPSSKQIILSTPIVKKLSKKGFI